MDSTTQNDPGRRPTRGSATTMLRTVLLTCFGIATGAGATWLLMRDHQADTHSEGDQEADHLYHCPMHPTITSDHPGTCPICGMTLVLSPTPVEPASATPDTAQRRIVSYRSPMDAAITSSTPRKDDMGMDYVPVYEDQLIREDGASVEGLATVAIDPARQQLMGLRTTEVTHGAVGGGWRTVARVEIAPPQVRKVNVKVSGYVEKVFVDFVGQPVKKGEALFSIYSPDLLAAQNEYILALQTSASLTRGGLLSESGESLVRSARRKLELWDIPASDIERLTRTRAPTKTLIIRSPIQGVVTEKNIAEGASLSPGAIPYEITDLSDVWVMADAYEEDLAQVKVGMGATLTLRAYPDRKFKGTVSFIDPFLNPSTRTLKVHLHFHNTSGELKPEMFGEVSLQGKEDTGLRVPFDAVIRSGKRNVVFVALGDGKFQPREVQLGRRTGDYFEVIRGLSHGERVVVRANFLVDSESRLKSSLATLGDH